MSLEFYCRIQRNFNKFKILGFDCRWGGVLQSPKRRIVPPSARCRECLREEEIFAICFRDADLIVSSKLNGVDLHF
jgi:hypothetical protein